METNSGFKLKLKLEGHNNFRDITPTETSVSGLVAEMSKEGPSTNVDENTSE